MNTKIKIILAVIVVVVITIIFFTLRDSTNNRSGESAVPEEEPIDVVLEFYNSWLTMVSSTTTDPFESELFASAILSNDVRNSINTTRTESPDFDPVICQSEITPERFRARVFPASATEARILVESRVGSDTLPMMSFVTLTAVNGAWQITDIDCTEGDVAPDVEFNYNRQGLLLKSVPPPFEAGKWHLVFEQDGQMGHVTPLFFSATTTCVSVDGAESICNPDTFAETTSVIVKGGLTETGAEVERIEFLQ
ncbi:MAG: hypothetical protein ACK42D_03640 [Candidatus Paceibacteria bacterium]